MIFRKAPAALRSLLPLANAFLILGILWPYIYHPATHAGREWSDALRGLVLGLSIGINLMAVWRRRQSGPCAASGRQSSSVKK